MNQNIFQAPQTLEKPWQVVAVTILTLISGITNIVVALGLTFAIVLGTIGIGLICAPITLLPGVLGIFEIIYAAQLLSNPPSSVKPSQTLAIIEICDILFLNVIALTTGILALVFYNDPIVQVYFARVNPAPTQAA